MVSNIDIYISIRKSQTFMSQPLIFLTFSYAMKTHNTISLLLHSPF